MADGRKKPIRWLIGCWAVRHQRCWANQEAQSCGGVLRNVDVRDTGHKRLCVGREFGALNSVQIRCLIGPPRTPEQAQCTDNSLLSCTASMCKFLHSLPASRIVCALHACYMYCTVQCHMLPATVGNSQCTWSTARMMLAACDEESFVSNSDSAGEDYKRSTAPPPRPWL